VEINSALNAYAAVPITTKFAKAHEITAIIIIKRNQSHPRLDVIEAKNASSPNFNEWLDYLNNDNNDIDCDRPTACQTN